MFEGELKECLVTVDSAGEYVCYAKNGRFIKFPAGSDLDALAAEHNAENGEVPLPAEETDGQADELSAWLSE